MGWKYRSTARYYIAAQGARLHRAMTHALDKDPVDGGFEADPESTTFEKLRSEAGDPSHGFDHSSESIRLATLAVRRRISGDLQLAPPGHSKRDC